MYDSVFPALIQIFAFGGFFSFFGRAISICTDPEIETKDQGKYLNGAVRLWITWPCVLLLWIVTFVYFSITKESPSTMNDFFKDQFQGVLY